MAAAAFMKAVDTNGVGTISKAETKSDSKRRFA